MMSDFYLSKSITITIITVIAITSIFIDFNIFQYLHAAHSHSLDFSMHLCKAKSWQNKLRFFSIEISKQFPTPVCRVSSDKTFSIDSLLALCISSNKLVTIYFLKCSKCNHEDNWVRWVHDNVVNVWPMCFAWRTR